MTTEHPVGDPGELAALYTAGALDPAECTAFEEHLAAGCARCTAELKHLAPASAALTACIPNETPNPAIRDALLRRVAADSAAAGSAAESASQVWRNWHGDDLQEGLFVLRAAQGAWEETGVPGVRVRRLFVDRERDQMTCLVRMDPGTAYPGHIHRGPEECLVLEGDLRIGDDVLRAGDYQRAALGSRHGVEATQNGCLLFIVTSLSDEIEP
jgi:anti-sigma factor ChrR (cupin superfamily)